MFMLLLKRVRTDLNSGNSFFLECYKTIQGKVIYIYLAIFSNNVSVAIGALLPIAGMGAAWIPVAAGWKALCQHLQQELKTRAEM